MSCVNEIENESRYEELYTLYRVRWKLRNTRGSHRLTVSSLPNLDIEHAKT